MHKLAIALTSAILFIAIQSLPFAAIASNAEILETECHKQLNLGDSGCACVGARAEKVLNEKQQGLVVAMITEDQAASDKMRANMTLEEITGAANFMMQTPQLCAVQ